MSKDDDYANAAYIPDGDAYYDKWQEAAASFRKAHPLSEIGVAYGPALAQTYDLFHPARLSKGTVIFVHGGYWKALSPRVFSHLATGSVTAGYAFAMVGYTLAPEARISQITTEVAAAIAAIANVTDGPLYLVGHSAGGHLVARMVCNDITAAWQGRVAQVMPISPIADLDPLRETSMNADLQIDAEEAVRESPAHHTRHDIPVTVWVGGDERPAFLEQARCLADRWGCDLVVDEGRHHFDVIEGLADAKSPLLRALGL